MNSYSTCVFWVTWFHDSCLVKLYFSYAASWVAVCASPVSPPVCLSHVPCSHLPRGSSPSSLRHRTVGGGSPCTSHRKSTVSSSITTWFTGLRTNTGRSAAGEKVWPGWFSFKAKHPLHTTFRNSPYTTSSAGSLSLSPTMFVPTHTYMPASLFLVWEIISLPPCIWKNSKVTAPEIRLQMKTPDTTQFDHPVPFQERNIPIWILELCYKSLILHLSKHRMSHCGLLL